MNTIEINQEPIELYKLLKFEGLVESGARAKTVIADGAVRLNGAIETQKRKKVMAGDVVEFAEQEFEVRLG